MTKFAQRPIFSGLRFFEEPEISESGPSSFKSLPEDLCSGFLRTEKIHRPQPGLNVTSRPPRPTNNAQRVSVYFS